MRFQVFYNNFPLTNILGIKHLGIGAKESDIKRAYRKMALKHHPDK